jgi:outer membrane lipoprotein LolB
MADHFSLTGRVAATHGTQGISAGLRWQQHQDAAQMSLSGPLGLGAVSVSLSGESIRMRSGDGRTLEGDAALVELSRLLGFDPPLQSLRFWVVGVPDPTGSAAVPTLDDQQRLQKLLQDGWTVAYDAYLSVHGEWLPRRLTVTREDLRLKLVIDDWQL